MCKISADSDTGWQALFAGSNKYKAIALAVGVLLNVSNIYLTTTILPTVVKEIGGLEVYSWNTSVFEVASIVGSVFSARLLAITGARKSYRIALLLFMLGTAVCAAAPYMWVMLVGRLVQGLSGGLLFALSYAMIRIVFEEKLWSRCMALISGMWGAGAFTGPFIGGIFAEHDLWRMAFVSVIVLTGCLLLLTHYTLPETYSQGKLVPVSGLKLTLLVLAVLSVSVGSIYEQTWVNLLSLIVAGIFLVILVMAEGRDTARLLPSGAYDPSTRLGAVYLVIVLLSTIAAVEIFVPYFAQVIYHYSPLQSGYLAVAIAFGWTFASMSSAGIDRPRLGRLVLVSTVLLAAGLGALSFLSHEHLAAWEAACMCAALLLVGIGMGVAWPHLSVKVFSFAPQGEEDLASASITTLQLLTMTFGAALGGLVANYGGMTHPGGIEGTRHASVLLYRFFMLFPLLVLLLLLVYRRFRDNLFRS